MAPPVDPPAVLVARFLRDNHYPHTLAAFVAEANLPHGAAAAPPGALTLEQLVHEKSIYDTSLALERLGVDDGAHAWSTPAPNTPYPAPGLDRTANVLSTTVETVVSTHAPADQDASACQLLLASTADRQIHALAANAQHEPLARSAHAIPPSDSPTLCCTVVAHRFLLAGSMAGKLRLHDLVTAQPLDERRDHQKYLVRIATAPSPHAGVWVASAAWDGTILVYHLSTETAAAKLQEPIGRIQLPSNPEAVAFVNHPDTSLPVLIVSRKDSTFVYYYALPSLWQSAPPSVDATENPSELRLLGRQNLAPNSNAWVAFTPAAFALSPKDPSVLAVATSHTPHMKLLIVRLLMPAVLDESALDAPHVTQAAQARAESAIRDREDAAILVQASTLAPQSPYSTPHLAWRPDGSGVWVNGDDGFIRGIEASTGKIMATLKGGHEPGTKVRCVWAGFIQDGQNHKECVVSGGFDRQLILWQPA